MKFIFDRTSEVESTSLAELIHTKQDKASRHSIETEYGFVYCPESCLEFETEAHMVALANQLSFTIMKKSDTVSELADPRLLYFAGDYASVKEVRSLWTKVRAANTPKPRAQLIAYMRSRLLKFDITPKRKK